jgi:hypothetical protein
MSKAFFAAVIAALVMLMPGAASAKERERKDPNVATCLGLTCSEPGSAYDVPEARGWVPSVRGPRQLARQTTAGFYEYGQGTTVGKRAVAYVVPYGQSESMPASIRSLPEVVELEASGEIQLGTTVIFGPDASLFLPDPSSAGPPNGRLARRDIDAYNCTSQHLCLYKCTNWYLGGPCGRVQFGAFYAGQGWFNLGDFSWNDNTQSVRNRRDNDSLLAEHNGGNGTQWCGQSHSNDTSLADEPIGGYTASSFRLTQITSQC